MSLETFYSVFNRRISDLSINSNNGSLIQSVSQDQSSVEYTAGQFHVISRRAGLELGEILREYEVDEIKGTSNSADDSKQTRLPVADLGASDFHSALDGIGFDEASIEVREYLDSAAEAFDRVWRLIDSVIKLKSETNAEVADHQKRIAEDQSLIDFLKDNALVPFINDLRACNLIKGDVIINLLAKMVDSTADIRAHLIQRLAESSGKASLKDNFISAYQAVMKEVFGEDVKLSSDSK